ncbi:unnamed protein product [Ceratitis capitata]|uniref:(Mediterranean fruit fly) hypothetical protein n=1 Tax=Ceratitis capitata TaxID=7213 RepID=A0A811U266_CERCA|nr:unnamed protein product [Ceratitis capitata]
MVLNKDPGKNKLSPRAIEGIFVGYPRDRKGYRIWVPSSHQIICARDVKFLEADHKQSKRNDLSDDLLLYHTDSECDARHEDFVEFPPQIIDKDNCQIEPSSKVSVNDKDDGGRGPGRPKLLRTGCRGRPRKVFRSRNSIEEDVQPVESDIILDVEDDDVFSGIAEIDTRLALNGPDSDEWKLAIESEIMSLIKNDTFDIIKADNHKNIVGCRFVLANKYDSEGKIERRKARLVAKGYSQKYGINYSQTFAPVARLDTVRLLLALAVHFKLTVWQFDVVTAYLNGFLEEEVLMKVPDMFPEMLNCIVSKRGGNCIVGLRAKKMLENLRSGGNVCKLKRALYGLKQSGRQWYIKLSTKLSEMGLKPMKNEPCLFYGKVYKQFCLLLVYVDDLLIASSNLKNIEYIKQQLLQEFEIKDLREAKYCLGLEIEQSENGIHLKQSGYVMDLLKQYGMEKCNPIMTPSEVKPQLPEAKDKPCEEYPYRELIGSLMYLCVATRPDIANTVSRLAQFVTNPSMCHWLAAKRVLRYLAGTTHRGLMFRKSGDPLVGYTDADWGGCAIDRRSYTGYIFLLSGAAITWKSQKQRTVALSSTEQNTLVWQKQLKKRFTCEVFYVSWAYKYLTILRFLSIIKEQNIWRTIPYFMLEQNT